MRSFAVTGAVVFFVGSAQAAPLPRTGTFVYSNLCWEKESGDASGYRIQLTRTQAGDALKLEWSEGPLVGPAAAVNVSIAGADIAFVIPAGDQAAEPGIYRGLISAESIVFDKTGNGGGATIVPRVARADVKIEACREP